MKREQALAILKQHSADLKKKGVRHAALFGSTARGDRHAASDIDIVIELDQETLIGVYDYVALKDYIAGLFDQKVDVVNREGLKPHLQGSALDDAVYAF